MSYKIKNVDIHNCDIDAYYTRLIGKFYKALPIYEGKDINTKVVIYDKDTAYNQYVKYVDIIITELSGGYYIIGGENFITLSNLLTGIQLEKDNHDKVRTVVFHCIDIIKKMKVGVAKNE